MKLFLDDERFPPSDGGDWHIVRTVDEAKAFVLEHGCPDFISFDHDLGPGEDAMAFVWWLIEQDMDRAGFLSFKFKFQVHSMNPVGARNIENLLSSYLAHRDKGE